jgi:dTDP-4-amino-4,6-dideoxygalactose transaminase
MTISQIDLVAQYRTIQPEIDEAIHQVLESGHFILGPNVHALEKEVADYLGVKHAVGVASGTDALILALRALDVGEGDEVIVPTYTFFATAEAVMLVGATPVFVDSEPDTYCLDVQQVAALITERSKAVIPVHLYGHPADMTPLLDLADAHHLRVIEDDAQAFGAKYLGRKTGSFGDIGCLSFFPSKNLGAYGDAGMVVTSDDELAEKVRMLRSHGWRKKYHPLAIGYNSRLDELQAAILRVKLRHLDEWNDRRCFLARRYAERLANTGIVLPCESEYARHTYYLFVIRVPERDRIQRYLNEHGIDTAVYYPQPLHLTEACRHLPSAKGEFPVAEQASRETLAIPLYPEMYLDQVDQVISALENAMADKGAHA